MAEFKGVLGERPIDTECRWPTVSQIYPQHTFSTLSNFIGSNQRKNRVAVRLQPEPNLQLTDEQQSYVDFIEAKCAESPFPFFCSLVCGPGGSGKTLLLQKVQHVLARHKIRFCLAAPTGISAFSMGVGGMTLHSCFGINYKTSFEDFYDKEPSDVVLERLSNVQVLIIDELSYVSARLLAVIEKRMRDIAEKEGSFGQVSVIMLGDIFQLPSVLDKPCWLDPADFVNCTNRLLLQGLNIFREFNHVQMLNVNIRQQDDQQFQNLLNHIRYKNVNVEDMKLLESRMKKNLSEAEIARFDDVIHLFQTNKSADCWNYEKIQALKVPVISTPLCDDDVIGTRAVYLGVGVKVMLRRNLWTEYGLVNGSIGVIKQVAYADNQRKQLTPTVITVEFEGYRGPTLDDNTVPIVAKLTKVLNTKSGKREHVNLFCVQNCFGITIHKSQSLTLTAASLEIGSEDMCYGTTYVACSRVKKLENILILDEEFSPDRFTNPCFMAGLEIRLQEEDRMRILSLRNREEEDEQGAPAAAAAPVLNLNE